MRKKESKSPNVKDHFKELLNISLGIVIGTLIFSHRWMDISYTFSNFQELFLPFTSSFIIYYLAQRIVSEKMKCNITYRLWVPGVILSMMSMLAGIKIFLIGGIVISAYKFGRWGMKDRLPTVQEIGFISVSGPLVSMFLVAAFKVLTYYIGANNFFDDMILINGWITFFNLIPIKELDGGKVMFWYPMLWIILIFFSIIIITPSSLISFFM